MELIYMKVSKNLFARYQSIGGRSIVALNGEAFELNEIGDLIWKFLSEPRELSDVVEHILSKVQKADRAVIERDLLTYLQELESIGLLGDA